MTSEYIARGDVAGAVRTFEDVPAEQGDEPWIRVAEAVMRVGQGNARAGLDILRALRASWPARGFSLLTYEMVLAASLRDAAPSAMRTRSAVGSRGAARGPSFQPRG